MSIDNLHIVYLAFPPLETNLPLIVDSDRVPVCGIGRAIGSREPIVLHRRGAVECPQIAQSDPLNLFRNLSGSLAAENLFRFSGFERFDHEDILTDETTRTWTTACKYEKAALPLSKPVIRLRSLFPHRFLLPSIVTVVIIAMMIVVAIVAPVIKTARQRRHKYRHHAGHEQLLDPSPHLIPPYSEKALSNACATRQTSQISVPAACRGPRPGKKVNNQGKITRPSMSR